MKSPLELFLASARRVLNNILFKRWLIYGVVGGGLIALLFALGWRIPGHQAPMAGIVAILVVGIVFAIGCFIALKRSDDDAAKAADETFDLKDSLTTALHFGRDGREGEIYDLQRQQAESVVAELNPHALRKPMPVRTAVIGVILAAGAITIGFLPASEAVQKRQADQEQNLSRTTEIKRELEELVDELVKEMDEDEVALMDPNELKKWVKELKETDDIREALRQFAKMEQKIAAAEKPSAEQRREEQLMKLAAMELEKSEKAEARKMGRELDQKKFKEAAKRLAKMKLAQKMKAGAMKPQKLSDKQKKLARLRAISRRMAAAAAQPNMQQGKAGKEMGQGNQLGMQGMMAQLDENAEMAEEMLEQMMQKGEEMDEEELEKLLQKMDKDMQKLADKMRQMNARGKMRNRLGKLRKALGRAQTFAMGRSQVLGLAKGQGKGIGQGSDESRREQRDERVDNGNNDRLRGQKGIGPSLTSVEDTLDGTGVSGRTGTTKERSFQRQFESFVRRDDVPEEVKSGVREYFERIHQNDDEGDE